MKGHFNNERDFGVEIEFLRPSQTTQEEIANALRGMGVECRVEGYNHTTRTHWKIVSDSSESSHRNGL